MVIPSLPGYGYSGKPQEPGWGPARIARAWTELMRRLGYTRFVAQGGDWGAIVTDVLAVQAPPELAGMHTTWPALSRPMSPPRSRVTSWSTAARRRPACPPTSKAPTSS